MHEKQTGQETRLLLIITTCMRGRLACHGLPCNVLLRHYWGHSDLPWPGLVDMARVSLPAGPGAGGRRPGVSSYRFAPLRLYVTHPRIKFNALLRRQVNAARL